MINVDEMKAKIEKMIEMQKALDKAIEMKKGLTWGVKPFDEENLRLAILDEIGELTHELKGNTTNEGWCWWKDGGAAIDKKKVLEELVDVWHFGMSLFYRKRGKVELMLKPSYDEMCNSFDMYEALRSVITSSSMIIDYMLILTYRLGFTIDDVYNAYIDKNEENYKRLARNY